MKDKVTKLLRGDQKKVKEILEYLYEEVENTQTIVVGVLSVEGEAKILHSPISGPEMCWIYRMLDHAINATFIEAELE